MVDAIVSFFKHEKKLNAADMQRIQREKAFTRFDLGCVLQERGKLPEAICCYQTCIKYIPEHIEAHYNLGISLHELNLLRDAEKHYKFILKLDPKHGLTLYNLGHLYQDMGLFDKAIRLFQESLLVLPNDIDVLLNLGICFRHIRKYDSALDTFRLVIELAPDNTMGLLNIGMVYNKICRFEQAILCFDQIIKSDKNNISAWFNLAVAYQDKAAYTLLENEETQEKTVKEMRSVNDTHGDIQPPREAKHDSIQKRKTKEVSNVTQQLALLSRGRLLIVLTDFHMALKAYETVRKISSRSKTKMKTFMYRDAKIASHFIETNLCDFHSRSTTNNAPNENSIAATDINKKQAKLSSTRHVNECDENNMRCINKIPNFNENTVCDSKETL